jgi:methionyl-tRNA formyltransferase
LIENDVDVACVLGLDAKRADRIADFADLRPLAEPAGIPFLPFTKVADSSLPEFLRRHRPDMLWVIGLSQLVPNELISIATHGGVGFHPTMLPRGRGRAPVAWTILLGARAAANLFFLTDQADAGDIIIQREVPGRPNDHARELIDRTNDVLRDAIAELAPDLRRGHVPRTPQDHARATYYGRRTPADGLVCWDQPAERVHRLIRAASRPYPGAFSYTPVGKVILWRVAQATELADDRKPAGAADPGQIVEINADNDLTVRAADGWVRITEWECEPGVDLKEGLVFSHTPAVVGSHE